MSYSNGPRTGAYTIDQMGSKKKAKKAKAETYKNIEVFRSFGNCGNHRKWLQLRACKTWCKTVRNKSYSVTSVLTFLFEILGLSASRAPTEGP